jgi:hypothetical protein
MSQARRYGAQYDGTLDGAPVFRLALQQPNNPHALITEKNFGLLSHLERAGQDSKCNNCQL